MNFLEAFDKRAANPNPPSDVANDEDAELLAFVDRIRATESLRDDEMRERILQRITMAALSAEHDEAMPNDCTSGHQQLQSESTITPFTMLELRPIEGSEIGAQVASRRTRKLAVSLLVGIASLLALTFGGIAVQNLISKQPAKIANTESKDSLPKIGSSAPKQSITLGSVQDDFANATFPIPLLASTPSANAAVEVPSSEPITRLLRVHGLVRTRAKDDTRWHVAKRGQVLKSGDAIRTSQRFESSARILAADGSAISIGPGALIHYNGAATETVLRTWNVDLGAATFEPAISTQLLDFRVITPDGSLTTQAARFAVEVSAQNANEPAKNATRCNVLSGNVNALSVSGETKSLNANQSAFLNAKGIVTSEASSSMTWLAALENELNTDRGIGQLVAKAEKANEHLALEIVSHSVTVTCVNQVARTFVDEIFVNNSNHELDGTFYYPLPADAAISEFAMFVDGKRIVGEVLEQQKARQVFEYIVRQQKDPALLEWAGGNLFKMRVYPIPARGQKRIQLGYTQILPRRNGFVTYSYPLVSEMLIKNPLQNLSIEFRLLSDAGFSDFTSPTHVCASALDNDGKRGALAFRAQKYTPRSDFAVKYKVPDKSECIAATAAFEDERDPYFMLQLNPATVLPAPKPPERLLVIVDGSGSLNAQDYAVATEFAASCADVSSNWRIGVMRGGQIPRMIDFNPLAKVSYPDDFIATIPADKTAEIIRADLSATPPLGATDLLATFNLAAKIKTAFGPLHIVYVGSGIDVVSEFSNSMLVDRINALFAGKDVRISTVAIGSTYEHSVLNSLAASMRGTFTRVEGAADVHAAVDQVVDGFYRPQFWNARVKIEGIETRDVHSESIGTLASGDTATVFGRMSQHLPKSSNSAARVIFSAQTDSGVFQRVYPIQFELDETRNTFIPRLWARAHNDALLTQMGLGTAIDDSRVKKKIIDNSVQFQIMSPYTSFLVLDSEEAYARYGIKRSKKRSDSTHPDTTNTAKFSTDRGKEKAEKWNAIRTKYVKDFKGDVDDHPFADKIWRDYQGLDPHVLFGDFDDLLFTGYSPGGAGMYCNPFGIGGAVAADPMGGDLAQGANHNWNFFAFAGAPALPVPAESFDEPALPSENAEANTASNSRMHNDATVGYFDATDYDANPSEGYGVSSGHNSYDSPIFPVGKSIDLRATPPAKFEFMIDGWMRDSSFYQRIVSRNKADFAAHLNWVLALEMEERYKRALSELALLINIFPHSPELKLEQGNLLAHEGHPDLAIAAMESASELIDEKDRAALQERIAEILANANQDVAAAERFSNLARAAQKGKDAARLSEQAASCWDFIGMNERSDQIWREMYTRWPENAEVNFGAGSWISGSSHKDPRGLNLLRKAAALDIQFAAELVRQLLTRDLRAEAQAEARRFLDAAQSEVIALDLLNALNPTDKSVNSSEAKRLLNAKCNPGQFAAIVRFWSSHNLKSDREFTTLIVRELDRENLAGYPRALAAFSLVQHDVVGMSLEKMLEAFKPLILGIKTDAEFALVKDASTLMFSLEKHAQNLEFVRTILKDVNLTETRRMLFIAFEFKLLLALNRQAEFYERHNAEYFTANATASEKAIAALTNAMLSELKEKKSDAVAERLAIFEKQFPNSVALPRFHSMVIQALPSAHERAKRDAAIERLVKNYPSVLEYLEVRARSLAQQGRFRAAADVIHSALNLRTESNDTKRSLIRLLGNVCSQENGLRTAFLKEAAENAKSEDAAQREWTQAALSCLYVSGDCERYADTLKELAGKEKSDLEWPRRYGAELLDTNRLAEARIVFEMLSNAAPDDEALAFLCRDVCAELKDDKAATIFFERAFESLASRPKALADFAETHREDNPEWSFRAYTRMADDPTHHRFENDAAKACQVAEKLSRRSESKDWNFKALLASDAGNLSAAIERLGELAKNDADYHIIETRARTLLNEKANPEKSVAAHLILSKLKQVNADKNGARAEIESAMNVSLLDARGELCAEAIFSAMESNGLKQQIEIYALKGGGALFTSERKIVIRGAMTHVGNDASIRLHRALLQFDDEKAVEDRKALVTLLLESNQLDAAFSEMRKFDVATDPNEIWNDWASLFDAFAKVQKNEKSQSVALDMWAHVNGDPHSGANALDKMRAAVIRLDGIKKVAPAIVEQIRNAYRSSAVRYFENDEDFLYGYNGEFIAELGLKSEFDALARKAEASSNARSVFAVARYMQNARRDVDVRRALDRVLELDPRNAKAIRLVCEDMTNRTYEWAAALKLLERSETKENRDELDRATSRIQCLYKLKRTDEAGKAVRELIQKPSFLRAGNASNVAEPCDAAGDFAVSAEIWEAAIRHLRAQNARGIDASNAAQFYSECGKAYAKQHEAAKALDCFLRGLSVIPRLDPNYKIVLDVALEQVLKNKTLEAAIAAHENNVKSDGIDKPHLRIAFASAYKSASMPREMLAQLQIAADLLPHDVPLRQEIIDGFKALNDNDAVIREYRRWSALDSQNIDVYRGWGDFYRALGRRDDELIAWATMAEIRPREAEGYRAYGERLASVNENEKAAAAFRQALKYRPTEYDIAKELAATYRKLDVSSTGDARIKSLWTVGENACRTAMETLPDDPQPWLNLGRFLEAQNRAADARAIYEKIALREWPRFRNETQTEATKRLGALK